MSPTYISSLVVIIVSILNLFGVKVGNDELTKIIEGGVAAIAGIIILYRRFHHGGINVFGQTR
jgi:uncharacterized membrane protein